MNSPSANIKGAASHNPSWKGPMVGATQPFLRRLWWRVESPRMVFAVDSVGGLLAAGYYFLLGHAAPHLGLSWFGLSMFAGVAVGLAVYSGICFLRGGRHWRGLLRLLIIGNGAHGLATVVWVGLQWREVTGWGIAAMTWDWIILSGVIAWECRMLSILSQTSTHGRTKSAG